jgi:hypothetical protein
VISEMPAQACGRIALALAARAFHEAEMQAAAVVLQHI